MSSLRVTACLLVLLAVLLVAGCGSSGSGTTAGAGAGSSTERPTRSVPVLPRGINGELSTGEAATTLHISAADCGALARLAGSRLDEKLTRASKPTPPLSRCRLGGRGAEINVYLDTARGAAKRYEYRLEETVQFNADRPARLPHPVPHVGEKSYGNSSANWIPAFGSLLAVRGNRWLTVTIAVDGLSGQQLRAAAATLARAGFKLTAAG